MKKSNTVKILNVLALILFLLPLEGFAKAVESKKSLKLIEPISLIKTEVVIKGSHPSLTKKDKKVHVVGRQRTSNLDEKTKVLQVVWTGLQNAKNQHAAFEKPFITVIQSHGEDLPKDLELPFEGDLKQLDVAYKKLKSGKVNEGKGAKALNPESDGRRVQGGDSSFGPDGLKGSLGNGSLDASALNGSADPASETQGKGFDSASGYSKGEGKEGVSKGADGSNKNGNTSASRGGAPGYKGESYKQSGGGFGAKFQPANSSSRSSMDSKNKDVKTVDVVECDPRIDEVQGRVYLQKKAIHKTNGAVTSEGQCKDGLKFFSIKRDYNGEGCVDYVSRSTRTAYDRYLKYWVDGKGERLYIGKSAVVDDEKPHPFIEERSNCIPSIDLESMTAHPQVETVYYGRGSKRVVVEACHKDPAMGTVPIVETKEGCEPLHNVEANYSQEQSRGFYNVNGVTHEAFACRPTGDKLPHQFNTASPCKPIKNMSLKEITLTGKRYVVFPGGNHHKLSKVCEPFGLKMGLDFSRENCTKFNHDFEAKKSYAEGKWSYKTGKRKNIVSGCMVGPLSYNHQYSVEGYIHDDPQKHSHEKHKVWIKIDQETLVIEESRPRLDLPAKPYIFMKNKVAASKIREPYFEGCYQFIPQDGYKVFKRCDSTEYLLFLNTAADIKSGNLCKVTTEKKGVEREYILDYRGDPNTLVFKTARFYHPDRDFKFTTPKQDFGVDILLFPVMGGAFSNYAQYANWETQAYRFGISFVYYRKGLRNRKVTIFPSGEKNYSAWSIEPVGKWIPARRVMGVIGGASYYEANPLDMGGANYRKEFRYYWMAVTTPKNGSYHSPGPNRIYNKDGR